MEFVAILYFCLFHKGKRLYKENLMNVVGGDDTLSGTLNFEPRLGNTLLSNTDAQ